MGTSRVFVDKCKGAIWPDVVNPDETQWPVRSSHKRHNIASLSAFHLESRKRIGYVPQSNLNRSLWRCLGPVMHVVRWPILWECTVPLVARKLSTEEWWYYQLSMDFAAVCWRLCILMASAPPMCCLMRVRWKWQDWASKLIDWIVVVNGMVIRSHPTSTTRQAILIYNNTADALQLCPWYRCLIYILNMLFLTIEYIWSPCCRVRSDLAYLAR